MRFVGWDLSDPFSRRPRPVDVAVVDSRGWVRFEERHWPRPGRGGVLEAEALVGAFPVGSEDVVVVDVIPVDSEPDPAGAIALARSARGAARR